MENRNDSEDRVVQTRLVRLGREFTQVHMDEKSRRDAVESAHWRTCSPHEWTWTPGQQANMALYCLWAAQRLEMMSELASGKQVIHEPNADAMARGDNATPTDPQHQ